MKTLRVSKATHKVKKFPVKAFTTNGYKSRYENDKIPTRADTKMKTPVQRRQSRGLIKRNNGNYLSKIIFFTEMKSSVLTR
jgi:hypothetical protein